MRTWMMAGFGVGLGIVLVQAFRRRASPAGPAVDQGTGESFSDALSNLLAEARRRGVEHVDVNASTLHRRVGGYPGPQHHMSACCAAMREALGPDDFAIAEPRSGSGPSLTLRYHLA